MTKLSAFEKALLSGQSFADGTTVESLERASSTQRDIKNILGGIGDVMESGAGKTAGGIADLIGYGSSVFGFPPEVGAKFFDIGEKIKSGNMRADVEGQIERYPFISVANNKDRAGPKDFFRKSPPELTPRNTTSEFNKAQLEKFGGFDNLGTIPKYSSEALKRLNLSSIDKDLSALQESLKDQPLKEMADIIEKTSVQPGGVPPEGIRFDRKNRKIVNTSGLPDEYVEDRLGGTKDESDVIERDLTQQEGNALQDAYMQTMQSISNTPAKGKTVADYKKEFYDATGIDSSGKIDKSDALMAFGLALLQNRAGKGFSAALRGIGEAGEKAQPLLMEAKKQAKAEKLAAGKYALDMVQRDKDSAAATAAAHDAFQREIALKNYEAELEMATFAQKQLLEGKDPTEIKSPSTIKITVGAKDYEIKTALEGSKTIYTNAPMDAGTIVSAHRKASDGLTAITQMESLVDALDLSSENYPGGATGKIFMGRVKSLLSAMGAVDNDEFFEDVKNLRDDKGEFAFRGISIESNIEIIRDALLARFKRFLSQETGNGISNIDMELLQKQAGTVGLFTNPAEYRARLAQLRKPFMDSLRTTEEQLGNMTQRYFYAEGDDGTAAFDKTQEAISAGLLDAINPIMGGLQGRTNIDVSDQ
jgi:hypothetical protein